MKPRASAPGASRGGLSFGRSGDAGAGNRGDDEVRAEKTFVCELEASVLLLVGRLDSAPPDRSLLRLPKDRLDGASHRQHRLHHLLPDPPAACSHGTPGRGIAGGSGRGPSGAVSKSTGRSVPP